jgi:hypothetical protein
MVMHRHDIALVIAGVIGSGSAVVHGVLTQRHIIKPLQGLAAARIGTVVQRLVAGLLQFSTFNWFVGGLALFAAAHVFEPEARLATGLLVGSSYLYAAVANVWATRGRPHPGWLLYGTALGLITYGLTRPAP